MAERRGSGRVDPIIMIHHDCIANDIYFFPSLISVLQHDANGVYGASAGHGCDGSKEACLAWSTLVL